MLSIIFFLITYFNILARAAAPGQPGQEELHHLPDCGPHRDQCPVSDQSEASIVPDSQSEASIL